MESTMLLLKRGGGKNEKKKKRSSETSSDKCERASRGRDVEFFFLSSMHGSSNPISLFLLRPCLPLFLSLSMPCAAAVATSSILLLPQNRREEARERTRKLTAPNKGQRRRKNTIFHHHFTSAPRQRCASSRGASCRAGHPGDRQEPRGGRATTWSSLLSAGLEEEERTKENKCSC